MTSHALAHRAGTVLAAVAVCSLAVVTPADAQRRGAGPRVSGPAGRAVPRGTVRGAPGSGRYARGARPYGVYGGGPRYDVYYGYPYAFWGSGLYGGFYYGSGWGYPYGWGPGWGYRYGPPYWGPGIAYGAYGPYGAYGAVAAGRAYGGVRIDVDERDAEVLVDGAYAGIVDDFDGSVQRLNLEPGPHRIEIVRDGFEPVAFDVNVEPGRTITYRTRLRPR